MVEEDLLRGVDPGKFAGQVDIHQDEIGSILIRHLYCPFTGRGNASDPVPERDQNIPEINLRNLLVFNDQDQFFSMPLSLDEK